MKMMFSSEAESGQEVRFPGGKLKILKCLEMNIDDFGKCLKVLLAAKVHLIYELFQAETRLTVYCLVLVGQIEGSATIGTF